MDSITLIEGYESLEEATQNAFRLGAEMAEYTVERYTTFDCPFDQHEASMLHHSWQRGFKAALRRKQWEMTPGFTSADIERRIDSVRWEKEGF